NSSVYRLLLIGTSESTIFHGLEMSRKPWAYQCFLPGGPYEIQIIESNKGLFGLSNVNLIRPP
ncbi:hypothetical protein, partial [Xanthomonas campestris]|uniref:hypothetical protein n=1 Tax=Xanthomonas campestris TaxID=339 RepID=UPI001F119A2E